MSQQHLNLSHLQGGRGLRALPRSAAARCALRAHCALRARRGAPVREAACTRRPRSLTKGLQSLRRIPHAMLLVQAEL